MSQADQTFTRTLKGFGTLVDRITPWLLDLGSWIFGALIAFNLLLLASLLTVGPIDAAVLVATAAVSLALPPAVGGFFVLRLLEDIKKVRLEDVAVQSFVEVGFSAPEMGRSADAPESVLKQRTRTVLILSYSLLALTVLLTAAAITGALWHMAWWIAVAFLLMTAGSQGLVIGAIVRSPSRHRPSSIANAPSSPAP